MRHRVGGGSLGSLPCSATDLPHSFGGSDKLCLNLPTWKMGMMLLNPPQGTGSTWRDNRA